MRRDSLAVIGPTVALGLLVALVAWAGFAALARVDAERAAADADGTTLLRDPFDDLPLPGVSRDEPLATPDAEASSLVPPLDRPDWKDPFAVPLETVVTTRDSAPVVGRRRSLASFREPDPYAASEEVDAAIRWLLGRQAHGGSWSYERDGSTPAGDAWNDAGDPIPSPGATGLALSALLHAGHTHARGEHTGRVRAALTFLASSMRVSAESQESVGDLRGERGDARDHLFATLALAEAYAFTGDKGLWLPTTLSLQYVERTAAVGRDDDSPAARREAALIAAGFALTLDATQPWRPSPDSTTTKTAPRLIDALPHANDARLDDDLDLDEATAIAAALHARSLVAGALAPEEGAAGVAFLLRRPVSPDEVELNFHATGFLVRIGGDAWNRWRDALLPRLVAAQVKTGSSLHDRGSWSPPADAPGRRGDRLYVTALNTRALQTLLRLSPPGAARDHR